MCETLLNSPCHAQSRGTRLITGGVALVAICLLGPVPVALAAKSRAPSMPPGFTIRKIADAPRRLIRQLERLGHRVDLELVQEAA